METTVLATLAKDQLRNAKIAGWMLAAVGALSIVLPFMPNGPSGWLVPVAIVIYVFIA